MAVFLSANNGCNCISRFSHLVHASDNRIYEMYVCIKCGATHYEKHD